MEELIKSLYLGGMFNDPQVGQTMLKVDRADFSPIESYLDVPQSIGYNATISAPHMHAYVLEHASSILSKPGLKHVLDVGSGSGYLTACFALFSNSNDTIVIGIEHIPELVEQARCNISKHHKSLLDSGRVRFVKSDGREGYEALSPYDIIHVGAASEFVPEALLSQLKPTGLLIIPLGNFTQQLTLITKDENGKIERRHTLEVRYVPLTDSQNQQTGPIP